MDLSYCPEIRWDDTQYDEADRYLQCPAWPIFCPFQGTLKFSMIGLGQEDEFEEITLRPEIWWHDAVYHVADHCMTWPTIYIGSVYSAWKGLPLTLYVILR